MMITLEEAAPKLKHRRFTLSEYHSMAELGFFEGEHVELLNGELIEMSPQNGPHTWYSKEIGLLLESAFGPGYVALNHSPLTLPGPSEPEPDVAVVRRRVSNFDDNPTSAILVIELSLSSYSKDRYTKAPIYARGGIPEYWIVNLQKTQLEVFWEPQKETEEIYQYSRSCILTPGTTVSPLALPEIKIAVADLFPPEKK